MASTPLPELVEESLDEAVFLWNRWESELTSLTRNLDDVWTWTEDRLHGALDGVRASGDDLPTRLRGDAGLESDDPRRLAVCGHLLAAGAPVKSRELLGDALRGAEGARLFALVRGIETAELDGSFAPLASMLTTGGPQHSAALCRLKAFRRANPGREVQEAYASGVASLQVEAVRAARRSADPQHRKLLLDALGAEDTSVRVAAIDSGVRLGLPEAWRAAIGLGQQLGPASAPVLPMLAMLGGPAEHQLVMSALRKPILQRQAMRALAYIGTTEAVETCLAGMKMPELARIAAESYCAVTGADLERDRLAAEEPQDAAQPIPFEADDLEADLVPQPEDLWPLPDLDAVQRHWREVQGRHAAGTRSCRGQVASLSALVQAVESGPMLRRPDLLIELAARTAGKYDMEPRAFAHVQRRMMSESRAAFAAAARP